MSELKFKSKFMKHIGQGWTYTNIEDQWKTGVWDTQYCIRGKSGWIEFKYLPKFNEKAGLIRIAHYTQSQRNFGKKRIKHGDRMLLALLAGDHHFIFKGMDCIDVGDMSPTEMGTRSVIHSQGKMPLRADLIAVLCGFRVV